MMESKSELFDENKIFSEFVLKPNDAVELSYVENLI